jgi:hypothetical protein
VILIHVKLEVALIIEFECIMGRAGGVEDIIIVPDANPDKTSRATVGNRPGG